MPITPTNVKPPKRKKWPLVLGGIGLFAAGVAVGAAGAKDDDPDAVATEADTRNATEPVVTEDLNTTEAPATSAALATTAAPTTEATATVTAVPTTTLATTAAPATSAAPTTTFAPAPSEPNVTPSQQNAIRSAQSYLEFTAFSRLGLIEQLSSEYGEQFPVADATFAVDSLSVDWNEQAVKAAQSYLDFTSFSCQGLIEQLSSEYGEQFTLEQATHAATQVGLC